MNGQVIYLNFREWGYDKLRRMRSTDARTRKVMKNSVLSAMVKVVNISTTMAVIPVTLHYLDSVRYGIWLTLGSILAWINIFDIGLGNGLRNRLAEALAVNDHVRAREYLSTTIFLLLGMAVVLFLFFECLNPFLPWIRILNAPIALSSELVSVVAILFGCLCLQFVLKIVGTVLMANQLSWLNDAMSALANVTSLGLLLVLVRWLPHGQLLPVALVYSLTPVIIMMLFGFWMFVIGFPELRPGFRFVRWSHSRELMGVGVKFFIIQIVGLIVYMSSNVLISQLSNPADVVKYNIAYRYLSPLSMAFTIVLTPLWTAYTDAYKKGDYIWIKATMMRTGKMALWFAVAGLLMVVLSGLVYRVWVGSFVVIPIQITIALALFFVLSNFSGVVIMFLNGIGALTIQLWAGVVAALIHIPLAILLSKAFGFSGVAWSMFIVSVFVFCLVLMQTLKLLNVPEKGG